MSFSHLPPTLRRLPDLAHALYGVLPETLTPLAGGNNHRLYAATFPASSDVGEKVFKIAGDRAHPDGSHRWRDKNLREQNMVRLLHGLGLPVPPVEWTQDDALSQSFAEIGPFFVMPRLPGADLEATLSANAPLWAEAMWERAGAFVAQLAQVPLNALGLAARHNSNPLEVANRARAALQAENLLTAPLAQALDEAAAILVRPRTQFIHTDYYPNQVVTDGQSFGVIDWESGAVGFPLYSLTRFITQAEAKGAMTTHVAWARRGYFSLATEDDPHEIVLWRNYIAVRDAGLRLTDPNADVRHAARSEAVRLDKEIGPPTPSQATFAQ